MEVWVQSVPFHNLGVVVHTDNLRTTEVGAGGSEVQGHLWLHNEFEAILENMTSCLKKIKSNKHTEKTEFPLYAKLKQG